MKQETEKHCLDEFEEYAHLWNIVPGGNGNGIVMLRKIVDSIQNNFKEPLHKPPTFLILGEKNTGRKLVARALANSLAIDDIRICPAQYFENGIYSSQYFYDSSPNTAHIITNIEDLRPGAEGTLWKYVKNRECKYYNHHDRNYTNILCCNGWIIMTGKKAISDAIKEVSEYINLEPLNRDQVEAVLHQKLVFIGMEYDSQETLKAIIDAGNERIDLVMDYLKHCLMLVSAEMRELLDMEVVKKVGRLSREVVAVDEDIPF